MYHRSHRLFIFSRFGLRHCYPMGGIVLTLGCTRGQFTHFTFNTRTFILFPIHVSLTIHGCCSLKQFFIRNEFFIRIMPYLYQFYLTYSLDKSLDSIYLIILIRQALTLTDNKITIQRKISKKNTWFFDDL